MNIIDEIKKITRETILQYCMTSKRLYLKDMEADYKLTSQYKGREIYELLQNIDDAAYKDNTDMPCTAYIEFDGVCLSISNHGRPFTISTLQRLCQGGVSDKGDEYIGCKGIGFRSVLNWAEEIMIYSGSGDNCIPVGFSADYTNTQLKGIFNSSDIDQSVKDHLNNQINELENKGIDSSFPNFRLPEVITPIDMHGYDTVIKLKVKSEIRQHIIDDIANTDKFRYILLFLPHITTIEFKIKENGGSVKNFIYSKSKLENGRTQLIINDNGLITSNTYHCRSKEERLSRKYGGSDIMKLAVGIPCDESEEIINNTLYTFFPIMDLNSPFPALLHATFFLLDNRNDLDLNSHDNKEVNRLVFRALLEFYIRTVVDVTDGERRLKLLQPFNISANPYEDFHFDGSLAKLNMENYFFEECRHQELFYTVNNKFLKGEDSPVVLESFPGDEIFVGDKFSGVVKFIANNKTRSFARRISSEHIDEETYLCEAINSASDNWSVRKRITVFRWWHSLGFNSLPRLLKVLGGKFLINKDEPCFLSEDEKPEWVESIPAWATISVLDDEDQNELLRVFKGDIDRNVKNESRKRVLARLIRKDLVDIQEQSSRQAVISPVNSSVDNDFERAKQFIGWLWKVWSDSSFDDTIKNRVNFVVPAEGGKVCNARNVYIGADYGNSLGEKLFSNIGCYSKLLKMDFGDTDIKKVRSFFNELGVSEFPRVCETRKEHVNGTEMRFVDYVLCKQHISIENIRAYNTVLCSIDNIEHILNHPDTLLILKWIFSDSRLRNSIFYNEQPENCCIEYLEKNKRNPHRLNKGWQLPSYMRFLFSNVRWFSIRGEWHRPGELIITNNNYLNDFGMLCVTESELDSYSHGICSNEELRNLLILLGSKTSFLELESDKFYGLLLNLPEHENDNGKAVSLSRDLYRTIIDNSPYYNKHFPIFEDSVNKEKYRQQGKILVKKNNRPEFVSIDDAYFSSSAVINIGNKYPIDVPTRRGRKEDFEQILFIKPFDERYTVLSSTISRCNDAFREDYKSFILCIMPFRKGRKDEIYNLTIELVEDATISLNGVEKRYCSKYTLLKKANRHWLICVGKEEIYSHLEKEVIADNIVRIFNVLLNFPSKEFLNKVEQLFIYSYRQRMRAVEDEFGSTDEIELIRQEIDRSDELKRKIESFFNYSTDREIIKQVNWNDPAEYDIQLIIRLLKQSGKGIDELNNVLEKTISVAPYNRYALQKEYECDKTTVQTDIYSTIKDTPERHKELVSLWNAFEIFIKSGNTNLGFDDIDFDSRDTYNRLKDKFYNEKSICRNAQDNAGNTFIKEIYNHNVELLKQLFSNTDLSLNDFINDEGNKSLLYFSDNNLEVYAREFINSHNKDTESGEGSGNKYYEVLNALINNSRINDDLSSGVPRNIKQGGKSGAVTLSESQKKEKKNKRQGNIAEYLVVTKLVEKAFKEVNKFFGGEEYTISWVSGGANEIRTIEGAEHKYDCSRTDDNAGYDIELVSKDGTRKMYIEVKSSSSENCSFFMSAKELEESKKKNTSNSLQQYRIVFVSGINVSEIGCNPKITFIDAPVEEVFNSSAVQYNMVYSKEKYEELKKRNCKSSDKSENPHARQ